MGKVIKFDLSQDNLSEQSAQITNSQKVNNSVKNYYIHTILQKSEKYLKGEFNTKQHKDFMDRIKPLYKNDNIRSTIESFERIYYDFVKEIYQNSYSYDKNLENFLIQKQDKK
ncbi:hypothetical protein [Helicobacter muridarum]|uniref:Putative modification methylase n=1 Tax=Helicobacter muridarum TaxID=216 RepID=A0A377PSS9_9HELI|nr:hypothetical protein [Helicobacter muridarum]STQ85462.1 putative modification methylase [Helicobacter muridarum]